MSVNVKNNNLMDMVKLFNFTEEEKKKFVDKHLAILNYTSYDELKELLDYLSLNDIFITKATQAKVCIMSLSDIKKNIGLIDNNDLCKSNPNLLSNNALDLRKRITYCQKNSIPLKDESGKYFGYILKEKEFNKMVNQNNFSMNTDKNDSIEENTLEPKSIESDVVPFEFASNLNASVESVSTNIEPTELEILEDPNHKDIKEYNESNSLDNDMDKLKESIISFAEIKKELTDTKDKLEDYKKSLNDSFIGFDELDSIDFDNGMGRAA